MKSVFTPSPPSHSRTLQPTNSGPLSDRMCSGDEQLDEALEHIVGPEPARNDDGQAATCELIDHGEHAKAPRLTTQRPEIDDYGSNTARDNIHSEVRQPVLPERGEKRYGPRPAPQQMLVVCRNMAEKAEFALEPLNHPDQLVFDVGSLEPRPARSRLGRHDALPIW